MRKDAREAAFKIIFSKLFGTVPNSRFVTDVFKKSNLTEEDCEFATRLISLTEKHKEELSAILDEKSQKFASERIFPADRALLLLALAEIKYIEDVPAIVSVNEAVGLARKYSTENSAKFVNGILAGVVNS